ncbi:hypothetical protein P4O66_003843 [Electrophorus voltai]|uniref:DUF4757 domain-containing protein n=1 Tax=Electrophorus voltai TaxID=2609070 RepID=A0AAD9E4B7_9TELE|nr:hypothetical protein P4O66_003843 [Electrophorus voltai]
MTGAQHPGKHGWRRGESAVQCSPSSGSDGHQGTWGQVAVVGGPGQASLGETVWSLTCDYGLWSQELGHSQLLQGGPCSPAHSYSEELYRTSLKTSSMAASIVVTSPLSPNTQASPGSCRKFPRQVTEKEGRVSPTADSGRDDMWARRSQISPKHGSPSPTHFLPVPSTASQTGRPVKLGSETEKPQRRPSWLEDDLSPTSMSMIDMRNEDDVMLPAHSPVRHELMHSQYNRMKEEESHWQDDLARWKSRRRSISQDLIKKEETRKMMEKLMKRDDGSQRRKSVKTYREIVEDKERRERELHEEYLKAKSPEEAAAVLQRYAQRFTISEAIMERLKLPRLLERSISADPTRGPLSPSTPDDCVFSPTSPSPLRYLRQQSLPAPKFTSTLEALVRMCVPQEGCRDDVGGTSVCTSTPRPNGHSRGIGIGARAAERGNAEKVTFEMDQPMAPLFVHRGKVEDCLHRAVQRLVFELEMQEQQDEMKRVNGEADVGLSAREAQDHWTESEQEKDGERKREGDSSPPLFYPSPSRNIDSDSTEAASTEAWSSGTPATASTSTHPPEPEHPDRVDTEAVGRKQHFHISYVQGLMCIASTEYGLFYANSNRTVWLELLSGFQQVPIEEEAVLQTRGVSPPLKEEESRTEALPESKRVPEERSREDMDLALVGQNGTEQAALDTPTPSQTATVAKQERKILEETVAPLTPHSPCWLDSAPLTGTTTQHGIVRSLANWECKKQELESQMKGALENKTKREHERKETAGPTGASESLLQGTCDQLAGQNGEQKSEASEQSKGVHPTQPGQAAGQPTTL